MPDEYAPPTGQEITPPTEIYRRRQNDTAAAPQKLTAKFEFKRIRFNEPLPSDLFTTVAEDAARYLVKSKRVNRWQQIKRAHHKITMWDEQIQNAENRSSEFGQCREMIDMIKAEIADAKINRLVDTKFVRLVNHCLKQIIDVSTLHLCREFFDALVGFYRLEQLNQFENH